MLLLFKIKISKCFCFFFFLISAIFFPLGEGRKRNQISVGHSSEVSLKVQEKDTKNLNASIVSPSGLEEPCYLKTLPNGHLGNYTFGSS